MSRFDRMIVCLVPYNLQRTKVLVVSPLKSTINISVTILLKLAVRNVINKNVFVKRKETKNGDLSDISKLIRAVHRRCMKFTRNFVLVIKNDELGPHW